MRTAQNIIASILTALIISGFIYWLKHMSVDFSTGFVLGMIFTAALLLLLHKLGAKLF